MKKAALDTGPAAEDFAQCQWIHCNGKQATCQGVIKSLQISKTLLL